MGLDVGSRAEFKCSLDHSDAVGRVELVLVLSRTVFDLLEQTIAEVSQKDAVLGFLMCCYSAIVRMGFFAVVGTIPSPLRLRVRALSRYATAAARSRPKDFRTSTPCCR
jgi:hypothetical protein